MEWYHYFMAFWSGLFLANFVPHFVHGISGNRFPTPFANPPGKGLSSPTINIFWSLFNLFIGYILFINAKISTENHISVFIFFLGIACISIWLSKRFSEKEKQ